MPAAHVEELQKLHRLYQRGEFDIDTVQTKHRLIVEYQRKRAVGGNLGTVYQNGGLIWRRMTEEEEDLGGLTRKRRMRMGRRRRTENYTYED